MPGRDVMLLRLTRATHRRSADPVRSRHRTQVCRTLGQPCIAAGSAAPPGGRHDRRIPAILCILSALSQCRGALAELVERGREAALSCIDLAPHPRLNELLSRCCEICVNDAGFQSGMAGAGRCPLIERAIAHGFAGVHDPAEWRSGPDGTISCSAFVPDDML
jgi:hypothetical protein